MQQGKIKRLEDFNVWLEARNFGSWTNKIINTFPPEEKWLLKKHMFENERHIPANIAEGFYRYHYKEKIYFYDVALGCLGEQKSDFYISFDRQYLSHDTLKQAIVWVDKIIMMLNGVIRKTHLFYDNKDNNR